MNAQRSWRPRRGRYLKRADSAALLDACGTARDLHKRLTGQGYELRPTMRPYLNKAGETVTLRFVWRRRNDGGSVTLSSRTRFTIEKEAG